MTSRTITSDEARARAEARFQKAAQRDQDAAQSKKEQETLAKTTAARVEHLRALRLAKEATAATPEQIEADAEAEKQRQALLSIGQPLLPPKPKRVRKKAAPKATAKTATAH